MAKIIADLSITIFFFFLAAFLIVSIFRGGFINHKSSYKIVDQGALLIRPDLFLKFMSFTIILSFGINILSDEPNVERYKGVGKIECFYKDDSNIPINKKIIILDPSLRSESKCINGYLQRNQLELTCVIIFAIGLVLFSFLVFAEKGIKVNKDRVSKEWNFLFLNYSIEIKFDEILCIAKEKRNTKTLTLKSKHNNNKFGVNLLYTQRDINFIENLINKSINKRLKAKDAARPA